MSKKSIPAFPLSVKVVFDELPVIALIREARQRYGAIESSRKSLPHREDGFVEKCIAENRAICSILNKKLEVEVVSEKLFENDTLPEVLDYCFNRFSYVGIKASKKSEIYSPFQIVPRVRHFMDFIDSHQKTRFMSYQNGHVDITGVIAGKCFFRNEEKLGLRNLCFPADNVKRGILPENNIFIASGKLFYSSGVPYNYEESQRGEWTGKDASGRVIGFKVL